MVRVLICDDDAGISTVLRAVLEDGGAAVEETVDGDACVEAVRRSAPDLVILDFMMPRQDGISALAEIRPEFPDLPVLLVSAYPHRGHIRSAGRGSSGKRSRRAW